MDKFVSRRNDVVISIFDMFCGSFHVLDNIGNSFLNFSNLKKLILGSWIGETMFEFVL